MGLAAHEDGRAMLKQAQMTGFAAAGDAAYDPHRHIIRKVMPAIVLPR